MAIANQLQGAGSASSAAAASGPGFTSRDAVTTAAEGYPGWPLFDADEIESVAQVLRSGRVNYWTGELCRRFEQEFAACTGSRHAVAVANGTVALELALRALALAPGDEVIVTPRTFVASASSIVLAGARPVFADVDPDSQNITPATVARVLGPRTRALMAVHLAGWPCDMPALMRLAEAHGLAVIEDCAQAHGARIGSRSVGSFGAAAAWSFCQDKIMTTGGEGGMLTTDREDIWKPAWAYKDHGKSYDAVHAPRSGQGFRWLHDSFGTNWRMLEMQAAIGLLQLRKLAQWHAQRARNAGIWAQRLKRWQCLRVPLPPAGISHAWYKFYAFVQPQRLRPGWSRDRILETVAAAGVPCFSGSCPEIYLERAFAPGGLRPAAPLPVAQELGRTSLMLLVHPSLQPAHIHRMADVFDRVLDQAQT